MTNFEKAVFATMKQSAGCDISAITNDDAKIYAKELMKSAIQQLRDDGNIVEIRNQIE